MTIAPCGLSSLHRQRWTPTYFPPIAAGALRWRELAIEGIQPGHPGSANYESRTGENEQRNEDREVHVGVRKCMALRYCLPFGISRAPFSFS
jgi:hypothetical protein